MHKARNIQTQFLLIRYKPNARRGLQKYALTLETSLSAPVVQMAPSATRETRTTKAKNPLLDSLPQVPFPVNSSYINNCHNPFLYISYSNDPYYLTIHCCSSVPLWVKGRHAQSQRWPSCTRRQPRSRHLQNTVVETTDTQAGEITCSDVVGQLQRELLAAVFS